MSGFFEAWAWTAGIITAIVAFIFAWVYLGDSDDDGNWLQLIALAYIIAFVSAFIAVIIAIGNAG